MYAASRKGTMRHPTFVSLGPALLILLATACDCEKQQSPTAKVINSTPLPVGWVEVSAQTPNGATVSLGVPGDWDDVSTEDTLIVRRAPTATDEFFTNVNVVVEPFEGTLVDYVDANKSVIAQRADANLKAESPVQLGSRGAYELVSDWSGPPRHALQLMELVGEEAIVVTCSMAEGHLESTRELCYQVFGTLSITP